MFANFCLVGTTTRERERLNKLQEGAISCATSFNNLHEYHLDHWPYLDPSYSIKAFITISEEVGMEAGGSISSGLKTE